VRVSNGPVHPQSASNTDAGDLVDLSDIFSGADRDGLGDLVEDVLSRGACLGVEEILDALRREGYDLGEDAEDEILDALDNGDRPYLLLADDRWVSIPALLTGRTLTHRLAPGEADHDVLSAVPDLVLFQLLAEFPDFERLADGGDLGFAYPDSPVEETGPDLGFAYPDSPVEETGRDLPADALDELGSLVLPVGTLRGRGLRAGDLVGLRYGDDGIEVVPVAEPAPEDTRADLLREQVLSLVEGDRPLEVDDVIAFALSEVPDAFLEPLPPIVELFRAWDLPYDDGQVAAPGFDFDEWYRRKNDELLGERLGLNSVEAMAATVLVAVLHAAEERLASDSADTAPSEATASILPQAFLVDDSVVPAATLEVATRSLAEPAVAYATLEQYPLWTRRRAETLAAVCERLEPRVARPGRVGLHWLWAKALEELGDGRAALTHLRTAERLDGQWPPVVVDLARYAGDRGDAATGLALLSRLEDDAAPFLRSVLGQLQGQPTRSMPRNAPCWCGSGRKFKQCHLHGGGERPLTERAEWPYLKALAYALETDWRSMVEVFTDFRATHSGAGADGRAGNALVMDVALFEGTVFAEYVARQGWLLPADELLLAQQWLLVERSVYEVVEVDPGVGVGLRDLRTGDHADVHDDVLSRDLKPGLLICTRLLPGPDGRTMPLRGLEPVRPQDVDGLIELLDGGADPVRLIEYLSRRFAAPTLPKPEGAPAPAGPTPR
jgi:hypothetical protein